MSNNVIINKESISVVSVAQQGPGGPQGPRGATGVDGAVANFGATGAMGLTGATGAPGEAGQTGLTGDPGPIGATGLPGDPGPAGATGATGAPGEAGVAGPAGQTGMTGDPGQIGAIGMTGADGADGIAGATGMTGDPGQIGATGMTGEPGPAGQTGQTGQIGATGAAGATGVDGAVGMTGMVGPLGATGATGINGLTGSTGSTGNTGATGVFGGTGTNPIFLSQTSVSTVVETELILNTVDQDFSGAGNWTLGTGWSVTGGSLAHTGANSSASLANTYLSAPITPGYDYKLSFNNNTQENYTLSIGGLTLVSNAYTGTGVKTWVFTATSSAALTLTTSKSMTFDNFSIKCLTGFATPSVTIQNSNGTSGYNIYSGGSGLKNTIIGTGGLITTGTDNLLVGVDSARHLQTGSRNTIVGAASAQSALSTDDVVAVGYGTTLGGYEQDSQAVVIGNYAGRLISFVAAKSGYVAIGYQARSTTNSVAIGSSAGLGSPHDASQHVLIGYQAGKGMANAATNVVAIGYNAGSAGVAYGNILIGSEAGMVSGLSQNNLGIGYQVLKGSGASYNVALGYTTGTAVTGSYNTLVGHLSRVAGTSGASNVHLGYHSGKYATTQSNEFFLDNQDRTNYAGNQTKSLVYGTFAVTTAAQYFRVNGNLQTSNGRIIGVNAQAGDYQILVSDHAVAYTGTGGNTHTLPAATVVGQELQLKHAGTGTLTITRSSTDTIDGAASLTLLPLDAYTLVCRAAGSWSVISTATVATTWDDLCFPATMINPSGSATPMTFDQDELGFLSAATSTQTIAVICQMPHAWKEGSTIYPHIHWGATTTGTGNCVFRLSYKWTNFETNDPGSWTDLTDIVVAADGAAYKHQMDSWAGISGTGKTISSILKIKISRIGGDAADTYADPAIIHSFDIHYEKDSTGSRSATAK